MSWRADAGYVGVLGQRRFQTFENLLNPITLSNRPSQSRIDFAKRNVNSIGRREAAQMSFPNRTDTNNQDGFAAAHLFSSSLVAFELGGHDRELVFKGETQRRKLGLDLLQSALDHDDVRTVTDETRAHFHELGRILRRRADGPPMDASILGGLGDALT